MTRKKKFRRQYVTFHYKPRVLLLIIKHPVYIIYTGCAILIDHQISLEYYFKEKRFVILKGT